MSTAEKHTQKQKLGTSRQLLRLLQEDRIEVHINAGEKLSGNRERPRWLDVDAVAALRAVFEAPGAPDVCRDGLRN